MRGLRYFTQAIAIWPVLGWSTFASAEEPAALRPAAEWQPIHLSAESNMERLLRIRLAFQKDPVLGPANLGIQYCDGVVTLWGPVSNAEHIKRAKSFAASQKGVIQVRSELYLGATGERLTGAAASILNPEIPVRSQAASPDARTGSLPPLHEELTAPPTSRERTAQAAHGANGPAAVSAAIVPSGQVLRFPKSEPGLAATTGLGSTAAAGSPAPSGVGGAESAQPRPPSIRNPIDPTSASDRLVDLRSSSDRFRGITWSLRGGHLEIQYSGGDNAPGVEFARIAQTMGAITSVAVKPRAPLVP